MAEAASAAPSPTSKDTRTWRQKVSEYMVNDGPKIVLIILWVLANIAVIIERFYHYMVVAPALFNILGHGMTLARSGAAVIKLNSIFILLSVLRNFLSWLRGTFVGTYLPIDKNIVFHRYIAWTIAGATAFHIMAHMFNFLTISNATPEQLKVFGLTQSVTVGQLAGTTVAGTTGFIITIVQILMYTSAIKYIRGPMFNVFWFTHHLFIVFFGLLCIHGVGQLLGEAPSFWYWLLGPAVFYAIERTVRILRGNQDTILQLAVAHPSKVLELQLKKSTFKYKPGQYLFLNCPYIAKYEWHPFTISSAPEEDFVSVHIRVVGDWTSELWAFLNPNKKLGVVQENLLTAPDGSSIFRIDGPFGTASEEVFEFQTVMLVAGGIGVTPFGSILKNIRYKLETQGQSILEKVYFYWISRDKNAFEWFNEVLAALEQDNINNFLEINTYLTGQMSVDEIRTIMHGVDAEADSITGLQSRTHFGRPNWDEIFKEKSTIHQGNRIGVFFCGPQVLSKQLYKYCKKYTSAVTKTKFLYHKENF